MQSGALVGLTTRAQVNVGRSQIRIANKKADIAARIEANPFNYIKLPSFLRCRACTNDRISCYVERTPERRNGDTTRKCACCIQTCEFLDLDAGCQSALQHWLDLPPGNNNTAPKAGSSTITSPATPAPTIEGLSPVIASDPPTLAAAASLSSASQPGTNTATPDLTPTQFDPFVDLDPCTDTSHRDSSAINIINQASNSDDTHLKRSYSESASTDTSSGRSNKSARIEVTGIVANLAQHEPGTGLAHHILGLSAWLETFTEKEKVSEGAMKDALQRCVQLRATITSMQEEEESLNGKIDESQAQRDTLIGVAERATAKIGVLEADCVQLKMESQAYKEEVDTLRLELEEAVEKGRKATETENLLEDERKAGRLVIADLDSQVAEIPELKRQYEAAVKNADESRKQRNETQTTLTTSQAENAKLVHENQTLIAEQEITAIELDEYRTGSKKSKVISAELDKTKAELATLQIENKRVAADNARLVRESGTMEEVKVKSKINLQLANDRLEQRQEMETELSHVKEERDKYEKKAKAAGGKAEEIKKNWNIAKVELLDVHERNRELEYELKKHADCPGANVAKKE